MYGAIENSKNKTPSDYFLSREKVPWYVAMFSLVATETSVLTFISIPGIAYRGDWTFLQLSVGYIIGRAIVCVVLLPSYFKNNIISIYETIGVKFGSRIQKLASSIFLITRILADGIRFLATSVILESITGWSLFNSVLLIGIVTLTYSLLGGIKTIVWLDSIQFILYLIGGISSIIFILINSSQSLPDILSSLNGEGKFKVLSFEGNPIFEPYYFLSALIGGIFLSLSSHGVDYMMVQRVLVTKDLNSARKAMIGSGVFVLIQFLIFLFAGSLIYYFYEGMTIQKDREFSTFIISNIPTGLRGILIAGILSAAMSTLSSSINSLASSFAVDWLNKEVSLIQSKLISLFWAVLLIGMALMFDESDNAIIVIGLQIASFTYGGLLGLFIVTKINLDLREGSILTGFILSLIVVFYIKHLGISWTWFILISTTTNIMAVLISNYFISSFSKSHKSS